MMLDDNHKLAYVGVVVWRYRWSRIALALKILWNALRGYELAVECYNGEPVNQ